MFKDGNLRIRLISIFVILLSLVVVTRLYFLQIVHGDSFKQDAERQYTNKNTVLYDRGGIYFQTKNGERAPAAITKSGFTLAINPSIIKNIDIAYTKLSEITPLDKEDFYKKAGNKSRVYEEVANRLPHETAERINDLGLYGVSMETDKWRFYPGNSTASRVIGFVGYDGDMLAGRYGLERYYDDTLRKDPKLAYSNFFVEFFSNIKQPLSGGIKGEGSIITTIEPSVQQFLESQLTGIRDKWYSDEAGGIVIDPMTGGIIAMSYSPGFNLNSFQDEKNVRVFSNPMVENVFEMGSIIKALTMASGLDSGSVTASTTYNDAGFLVLNGKRISNYDGKGRGVVNMQRVLDNSLNTGATFVALKMGMEKSAEYLRDFGLGTETGIDLPNETVGLIKNLDSKREIEHATASYGQGIALTPIATVRALSALANGGKLITPHIVKEIDYTSGLSKKMAYDDTKQVIKPETSREISRMLVSVVDHALRDGKAKIPGYSIAAKTGTAQMADEGRLGYVDGKYLHSFFGYFPAYKPRFLIFFFHTYPKDVQYASETLTEPFLDTTKFLINYYEIPPDRLEDVSIGGNYHSSIP